MLANAVIYKIYLGYGSVHFNWICTDTQSKNQTHTAT